MSSLDLFSPATRAWFESSFPAPTPAQEQGWETIAEGRHTLIHAPTGSGKTLAAFLWTLDRLLSEPLPDKPERCRVLYVSPLKALAYDIERNLRAPLTGIRHAAQRLGTGPLPALSTFLRTGDTPSGEREKMLRNPPDLLITTPESLYLLLTSRARELLGTVRWVIVDEVHAVADGKRGAHLALSLERLEEITDAPQRIGLSATQRPLDVTARFLGGDRPVAVVDVESERDLDISLIVPVADMTQPTDVDPLEPGQVATRSIWPAVYPRILELINSHSSTIVFANSRRLAEKICGELNQLAGKEIARSHHGSVSHAQRSAIEEALKRGELKAVVATSSLELGIDMGAVDLVIQVEAPTSVTSGLQRVGRAGHQVGETSLARLFPKHRGDLLVSTVVSSMMVAGMVEAIRPPRNPLDVLAQQLVAAVVAEDRTAEDLYAMVVRAAPFSDLPRPLFDATLDMLAGRYPSDLFAELRPRLNWDRVSGSVTPRPGARQLAVTNPGTIPDRGLYRVTLPDGSRVGELDEEMVYESRQGDVFLLGASTWRIAEIGIDRVEVVPAPGETGAKLPFWHGDVLGRSLETGKMVGSFTRQLADLNPKAARSWLMEEYRLDELAADNLVAYVGEELEATGTVPSDRTVVLERFRDEIGDWRLVLMSPFGARVHAPWAMALTQKLQRQSGIEPDLVWSDDGIILRFVDTDEIPGLEDLMLDPDEVETLIVDRLAETALFAARFRQAAGRSLLLPRRRPGSRTPLWLQRRRAAGLLEVARQFGSFPIVLETYREILQDDFDLPGLQVVLGDIASRRIHVDAVELVSPSPFASSLLFAFVAAYLYEGDAPLAERRAAALTLDRDLLRQLLGDGELSELLSPAVMAQVEADLQHLTDRRKARTPDAVADLLRDLGPLTLDQIQARSEGVEVGRVTDELKANRRVIEIQFGSGTRLAAIEDASRLRDALGIPPPPGIPHTFLEPVEDPLGDVVGRYARTNGPFSAEAVARELNVGVDSVSRTLERLLQAGRVSKGRFRTGQGGFEWVDSDVLRRVKRGSLAALRGEIEPEPPSSLGRFLPAWQGVVGPRKGRSSMLEVVRQLQGAEIPASDLASVMGARIEDPDPVLDRLLTEGEVMWVGRQPLGPRDGKVALFLRSDFDLLHRPVEVTRPTSPIHERILHHLEEKGASFFADIYTGAGGGDLDEVSQALWDLVWAGKITNDTFAPLRAYLRRRRRRSGRDRLSFPPHTSGRWSRLGESGPYDTARAAAWATQLLDRYGLVTPGSVAYEGLPGGFSALYPVFGRMEETGSARRGYFVEGLGGAQFALPGAIDRLRAGDGETWIAMASTDPANPYGACLSWPETEGRIGRHAGTHVVLAGGELVAFVERRGRRIVLFPPWEGAEEALAGSLAGLATRIDRFSIDQIDGASATNHPITDALIRQGFVRTHRGLTWPPGR
ncbi:MAG: DEAD/DEAH box helicase [Acidimicrobiia bacterium]